MFGLADRFKVWCLSRLSCEPEVSACRLGLRPVALRPVGPFEPGRPPSRPLVWEELAWSCLLVRVGSLLGRLPEPSRSRSRPLTWEEPV